MKPDRETFMLAVIVVVFIWGLFLMFTLGVYFCGGSVGFGQMGEAFNILNTFFAGLAFTAICCQLWMQQTQIDDERQARYRADRISALTASIQTTYAKIDYERKLLYEVAPGLKRVSFMHDGDAAKTAIEIQSKESNVTQLNELIGEYQKPTTICHDALQLTSLRKDRLDNEVALQMLKQIKKWVDQLESYEKEMDGLLKILPTAKEEV